MEFVMVRSRTESGINERQSEAAHDAAAKLICPTQNLALAALPHQEANTLVSLAKPLLMQAGEVVYEDRDKIDHVYFPINSVFSSLAILEDGSSVEVSMTGREGIVGLAAIIGGGRSLHWTRVSVPGA